MSGIFGIRRYDHYISLFCLKIMKQVFFLSNPKRIMQIRVLFQHLRQEIWNKVCCVKIGCSNSQCICLPVLFSVFLYTAMQDLGFAMQVSEHEFKLYDAQSERKYLNFNSRQYAQMALLKILFPINIWRTKSAVKKRCLWYRMGECPVKNTVMEGIQRS